MASNASPPILRHAHQGECEPHREPTSEVCRDESYDDKARNAVSPQSSELQSNLNQMKPSPEKDQHHGPWANPVEIAVGRTKAVKPLPTIPPANISSTREGSLPKHQEALYSQPDYTAAQILDHMSRTEAPLSLNYTHDNQLTKAHIPDQGILVAQDLSQPPPLSYDLEHRDSMPPLHSPKVNIQNYSSMNKSSDYTDDEAFNLRSPDNVGIRTPSQFRCTSPHCVRRPPFETYYLLYLHYELDHRLKLDVNLLTFRLGAERPVFMCPFCPRPLRRYFWQGVFERHMSGCENKPEKLITQFNLLYLYLGILVDIEITANADSSSLPYLKTEHDDIAGKVQEFNAGESLQQEKLISDSRSPLQGQPPSVFEQAGVLPAQSSQSPSSMESSPEQQQAKWIVRCPVYGCSPVVRWRKEEATFGHHQKCRKCVERSRKDAILPYCHHCHKLMEFHMISTSGSLHSSSGSSVSRSVGSSTSSCGG